MFKVWAWVRLNKIIVVFPVTRPSLENHADPVSFYLKKRYKIKYYGADPKPHFCAHRPGMFLCFFLYFLFIQTRLSDTSNLCHFVPWSLQSYVPTGTPRVVPSVHTHTPHAPGPSRQIQLLCLYILEVCLQHLRKLKTCLRKLKHFTCENVHISNIAHWNFELAWLLFLRGSVTYLGSSKKECRGVFRNLSLRLFADKVGGQALQFLKSYFLQFCFYDLRIH